ncbi:MAG: hypothetical protein GVY30_00960, partial [Chloroflexi bacterium]|nr:hypothetical protein [Chloroflexota bacterium]
MRSVSRPVWQALPRTETPARVLGAFRRVIDLLAEWFGSYGLEVEVQELELLLHEPVDATVQVLPTGG